MITRQIDTITITITLSPDLATGTPIYTWAFKNAGAPSYYATGVEDSYPDALRAVAATLDRHRDEVAKTGT